MPRAAELVGVVVFFIGMAMLLATSTSSQRVNAAATECDKYKVIYARGSGQNAKNSVEFLAFKKSLSVYGIQDKYIIEVDTTSTGMESYSFSYRAADVLNASGTFAVLSRGQVGEYSSSVKNGKELLISYLTTNNFLECGTRLVFAGYSQGANLVTDALTDQRLKNYLPQVSFVATFGDPSLDLNSVFGGDLMGKTPWYRGNAAKYISGGLVKVRNPYVPSEIQHKIGAWCHADDMICTGNLFQALNQLINNPHGLYPVKAIPAAAKEIAARLTEDLKLPFTGPACGALKQDIVLAVNVSPSVMTDPTFLSDAGLKKISDGLKESSCDTRVAMVTFGRKGKEPTKPEFDFGSKVSYGTILSDYQVKSPKSLSVEKADILGAVDLALDMSWREDAQKAIIVLSDGPGDNYTLDRFGSLDMTALMATSEMRNVLKKSRQYGGVEIHATNIYHQERVGFVHTTGVVNFYRYMDNLVKQTAGTFANRHNCNICSWLNMQFDYKNMQSRKPVVSVSNIRMKKGQTVELGAQDVSGGIIPEALKSSYGINYTWHLDCGRPESQIHAGAKMKFTPTTAGVCKGAVLVKADAKAWCNICYESNATGARAVTTFDIEILPADHAEPPTPGPVQNIKKERLWDQDAIRITWDPPVNAGQIGEVAYVIRDMDGTVLGVTRQTKIHIIDVPADTEPLVMVSTTSATSSSAPIESSTAEDITPPQSTPDVLGDSDEIDSGQQSQQATVSSATLSAPIQLVTKPLKTWLQTVQNPTSATLGVVEPMAEPYSSVTHQAAPRNNEKSWWTRISIVAMPLAAALALGFIVKHGLTLWMRAY